MLQAEREAHQNQYLSSPIKPVGIAFQLISSGLITGPSDDC